MISESTITQYLQDLVFESGSIEEFLDDMTRLAVRSLSQPGDEVLCGITLLRHKKAGTVASSSERARKMDEIQYKFSDGPCLTASREQRTVQVADLRDDTRWPEYTKTILHRGMRSILAVPFDLESDAKAALNLYADEPGYFDDRAVETAEDFARQTSRVLRLSVRFAKHSDTELNLKAAMESRTSIDMAVGIVMGQSRCTQEEAFAILKTASSTRNIKLRDLAADMVSAIGQESPRLHFDD